MSFFKSKVARKQIKYFIKNAEEVEDDGEVMNMEWLLDSRERNVTDEDLIKPLNVDGKISRKSDAACCIYFCHFVDFTLED